MSTKRKVDVITNSHTAISKMSIAAASSPHKAGQARTNTSMWKMWRQIYLLRLTSKHARKEPREADGTPARPGTATIDPHQCRVGGVRHSGPVECVSASALRADGGVYDFGSRMSATYRLHWR
jgi:hypothetical protein